MIKEKSKELYKNLSQDEKDKIKEYQRQKYQETVEQKKEALRNKWFLFSFLVWLNEWEDPRFWQY